MGKNVLALSRSGLWSAVPKIDTTFGALSSLLQRVFAVTESARKEPLSKTKTTEGLLSSM